MREWIDQLSVWIEDREEAPALDDLLDEFAKEMNQTGTEIDSLLQASDQLQSIYSDLIGKVDHADS